MSGSAKGHPNKPFSEPAAPKYGKGKPKQQDVKILHINVRSVRRKIDELEAFLADENIDVLCLTEHWLTKEEMELVHLQRYMMRGSSERKHFTGNFDTFLESLEVILTQFSTNSIAGNIVNHIPDLHLDPVNNIDLLVPLPLFSFSEVTFNEVRDVEMESERKIVTRDTSSLSSSPVDFTETRRGLDFYSCSH
ncbi:unnamed protein product [Acanthoscelides obtectus]|uniref:Uncharacterized protein n=1 Tax=Acanthoscelides obtectus TaxID=200917 RepID=A0A9P0KM27_ACAOB|nr:unnamed protein product [Acanthoscelides obtectus]CAK1650019.1 hypothetical protein AOBTE_LOCUS16545 [Acanthoscelides obtectus]